MILPFGCMEQVSMEPKNHKIERRFYQEVLSPDLKVCKQASIRFSRFCRLGTLCLHETVRYFNRHPPKHQASNYISSKNSRTSGTFALVVCYEGR